MTGRSWIQVHRPKKDSAEVSRGLNRGDARTAAFYSHLLLHAASDLLITWQAIVAYRLGLSAARPRAPVSYPGPCESSLVPRLTGKGVGCRLRVVLKALCEDLIVSVI